jgi:hypothetical protein
MSVLRRSARQGHQGYPVATVAFYGPDDKRASKVVLGIAQFQDGEPELVKWISSSVDLRNDPVVMQELVNRIREEGVRSVVMVDRIIGCPHEEGIDYPEGEHCPQCLFWKGRNRFTGELEP